MAKDRSPSAIADKLSWLALSGVLLRDLRLGTMVSEVNIRQKTVEDNGHFKGNVENEVIFMRTIMEGAYTSHFNGDIGKESHFQPKNCAGRV